MKTYIAFIAALFVLLYQSTTDIIIIVTLFIALWYWNYYNQKKIEGIKTKENSEKWERYVTMAVAKPVLNHSIYPIHKGPRSFKYITDDAKKILYKIDVIIKYNPDIFADILIFLEYFFKIHYNAMLGKYDPITNLPILKSIYNHILGLMDQIVYNIPKRSTVSEHKDLDILFQESKRNITALMNKYIKIMNHKYSFDSWL